ncbi:MAG: hypothetical protein NXI04_13270 [Planctomycetaceae bacterium]|nr:hypothetical protein [Planctomycetaceae bacterium]
MSEPLTLPQRPASLSRNVRPASTDEGSPRCHTMVRHHAATLRFDAAHESARNVAPATGNCTPAADSVDRPPRPQQAALDGQPAMVPVSYPRRSGKSKSKSKSGTGRIQLRLSRNLVAILKAFAKAGQRPSRLVESSLWSDPQMRDAALLLGIPVPEIPPRRLNRIRPKNR